MQTKTKVLLALLFLPGIIAEVISTNMPVYNLLNPASVFLMVLVYGCGTLLIREAKVRWKMQWSVVLLAIAYGIFEEGLVTQAFFNPYWFDPGALSGNWVFFGVQWGWTITLLAFHASISTLIPIYMIGRLWPEWKNKPLLGNLGTTLALLGAIAGIGIGMRVFAGPQVKGGFFAPLELLFGSAVIIAAFILLARRFRKARLVPKKGLLPPAAIGFMAFFLQAANIIIPNLLAAKGKMAEFGILIQLSLVFGFAFFSATQLLNKKAGKKHIVAYVFGSLLFWILISFIWGLSGRTDLLAVAPVALLLLIAWRRRVLKR